MTHNNYMWPFTTSCDKIGSIGDKVLPVSLLELLQLQCLSCWAMESCVKPTSDTSTYSWKLKNPLQIEGKKGSKREIITYATLP